MYGHDTIKIFNEQLLLAVGLEIHLFNDLLRSSSLYPNIWYNIYVDKKETFLQLTAI